MVRELQKSDLAEAAAMLAALHAVHRENVPGIFGDHPAGYFEKEAARILKDRWQGVATALLQAMLTAIRQKGISHVQLKVWAFNEPAAAFYKKVGFQSLFETMDYVLR